MKVRSKDKNTFKKMSILLVGFSHFCFCCVPVIAVVVRILLVLPSMSLSRTQLGDPSIYRFRSCRTPFLFLFISLCCRLTFLCLEMPNSQLYKREKEREEIHAFTE